MAVHNLLRDVVYHWANTAMQNDPVSEAKYRALRDRGHGHHRALRTVADRLLYVACAMLRDGTVFDPHHARAWCGSPQPPLQRAPGAPTTHDEKYRGPAEEKRKKTLADR